MWIYLGVLSAVFLGLYDVSKKHALRGNAVWPVLFLATCSGALILSLPILLSRVAPASMMRVDLFVPRLPWVAHVQIFAKAWIVGVSWILAYFALRHLPISIVSPIRAGGPLVTLLGAMILFGERPTGMQWVGLAVILCSYYAFSVLGQREGIDFRRNRWVYFAVLAMLAGAASSLYDKFLVQGLGLAPLAVQAWSNAYLIVVLGIVIAISWSAGQGFDSAFEWRWSIPAIGVLLTVADFAYFRALGDPDALISLLAALRRSCVVVSFTLGGVMFGELNLRGKALALAGVLCGVFLILFTV